MSRRSTPQNLIDERAFPVRIILRNPGSFLEAFGSGRNPHRWLGEHAGTENAKLWPYRTPFVGEALALYCRDVSDAATFLNAFPEFELADGTVSPIYNAPGVFGGVRLRRVRE